ncbi:MAG: hypothetical protein QOD34_2402, partial [Mycobacterium sp.]|nr:hypothetical protein [Mycobacterium sp.]
MNSVEFVSKTPPVARNVRCRVSHRRARAGKRNSPVCVHVSGITLTRFKTPSSGDDVQGRVQPVLRSPGGFTARRPGNAAGCGETSREHYRTRAAPRLVRPS